MGVVALKHRTKTVMIWILDAGAGSYDKGCGLCAASLRGHVNIVKLENGGVPTREYFEVACLGGFTEIVKLLLATGVQYNHSINSASGSGHADVVQVLLNAGANANAIREAWKYVERGLGAWWKDCDTDDDSEF